MSRHLALGCLNSLKDISRSQCPFRCFRCCFRIWFAPTPAGLCRSLRAEADSEGLATRMAIFRVANRRLPVFQPACLLRAVLNRTMLCP